ncbi:hypothetical protein EJ04DRAFT_496968 [Polyplosphaeria fusca]|uniref:NACHT domain-containing protein n=1 Tax=Polyplosphaeria fusca TaxID=682080 RepID=A0A9P4QTL6_9PLEO|nr:hypothetical protein EJ04DRAFT_496968 [Polyplosphaeria fusca]
MNSVADRHARFLFQDAIERLQQTVGTTNPQQIPHFANSTLKDMYQACREIEIDMRKRRCVRNMARLKLFLDSMHHYHPVVEVLCNGTPYVSWIWGPMKLIFQIASEYPAAIEKLVSVYSRLGEALPRFDKLSEAFRGNSDFQRRMALIISDIVEFHREAYLFFQKKGWKYFFATLWGNFDRRFSGLLDRFSENCRLLEMEASTTSIVEDLHFRRKMEEEIVKTEKERIISQRQEVLKWLNVQDEEQEDALFKLRESIHAHSCDWIQRKDPIKSWMSIMSNQPVMWLTGKPGAGKSVLSSAIANFVRLDRHSTVLYYFCNIQHSQNTKPAYALSTLTAELIRDNTDLASYVYEAYVAKSQPASNFRIKQLLQELLNALPFTRIIVDGVDELDFEQQQQILDDILPLATTNDLKRICKVLISCRNIATTFSRLRKYPTLDLDKQRTFMDASISSYIKSELAKLCSNMQFENHGAQGVFNEMEHELMEKAEGMFLWVNLVICSLKRHHGIVELRKAVRDLPKGLDAMYSRIMAQILHDQDEQLASIVMTTLSWVVHSVRPLKTFELVGTLCLRSDDDASERRACSWEWLFDTCKPLLTESKSGSVQFMHFTTRE